MKTRLYYPNEEVKRTAKRVLMWKEKHGKDLEGLDNSGLKRAAKLAKGEGLSFSAIKGMYNFFKKHPDVVHVSPEYRMSPWKDKKYLNHQCWGGNAAKNWAKTIIDRDKYSKNKDKDMDFAEKAPKSNNMTKQISKYLAFALSSGEKGHKTPITKIMDSQGKPPMDSNNYLLNEAGNQYAGSFQNSQGQNFDFVLKQQGENWRVTIQPSKVFKSNVL